MNALAPLHKPQHAEREREIRTLSAVQVSRDVKLTSRLALTKHIITCGIRGQDLDYLGSHTTYIYSKEPPNIVLVII